jgi:hypothetical protein
MMVMHKPQNAASKKDVAMAWRLYVLSGAAVLAAIGCAYAAERTALFIDEKGRVGIGTQKPTSPLSVTGGAVIASQDWVERLNAPQNGLLVQGPVEIGALSPVRDAVLSVSGFALMQGGVSILGSEDAGRPALQVSGAGGMTVAGPVRANGAFTVTGPVRATGGMTVDGADGIRVNGPVTAGVRYQRDDEPETSYDKPLQRYHMSLTAQNYSGRSKTIPKETLERLCGARDGCEVRLGMTRWDGPNQTETASRSFLFYYSPADGHWRTSGRADVDRKGRVYWSEQSGVAGNKVTQHAYNIYDTCYFTDGTYANRQDQGDKNTGMQLLVWQQSQQSYKNSQVTCELTLIP